ncbi:hypothetical protein BDE02_13G102700 [Populus trichocarpa]|nr:hypothetical protein BDE02_13G102700 [Populus trichocarpa]KAI5567611.1 hypothetical protein BDE02_13G102700 [Populus trichocarpa]
MKKKKRRKMKRKHGEDTPDPHQDAPPPTKKPTLPVSWRRHHRRRSDGSSRSEKERKRGKEKKKRREGEKTKIERGREEIISPNHQHPVPRRGRLREFGLAQEMLSAFHNVGGDMKQLVQSPKSSSSIILFRLMMWIL